MDFQIDVSLQQFAMISYAESYWNRPHIKEMLVCAVFEKENTVPFEIPQQLFKLLLNEAKTELKTVPTVIYNQLIHQIILLGSNAFDWCCYAWQLHVSKTCLPLKLFHFTGYGTVDKAKAEKELVALLHVQISDKETQLNFAFYYMASTSIQIDFINIHSKEIFDFCLKYMARGFVVKESEGSIEKRKLNFIFHSVLFLAKPDNLKLSLRGHKNANCFPDSKQSSKEAYMFQLAVNEGHDVAVRYYYSLLNPLEREDTLLRASFICIKKFTYNLRRHFRIKDYSIDILILLLMKLSKEEREKCLSSDKVNVVRILPKLIYSPCYGEFFFPVFALVKSHIPEGQYVNVLNKIIEVMAYKCVLGIDCKTTVYYRMFFTVWEEIEKGRSSRSYLVYDKWCKLFGPKCSVTYNLFEIFDVEILNLILNFECSKKSKMRYLREGRNKYKELAETGRKTLLKKFMEVVLVSTKERNWFVKQF